MKLLRILLLAISLSTTLFVRAYDFEANGLYYDIISAGDLTCALVDGPSPYTGALVIPDEVEYMGKKLKVIGVGYATPGYPLKSCKLKEVSSVQFGKNVKEIYDQSFKDNQLITNITIPLSISEIASSAFENCTSLTSVTWGGDMVLSNSIFKGCTKLKTLSYKSICKEIPNYAFYNCSSLSLDLSEVEELGWGAFYGCSALKKIDLSSIKGDIKLPDIFNNCGNISMLIIGSNINSINQNIWENCIIDSLVISPSSNPLYLAGGSFDNSNHYYNGNYYCPSIFYNKTSINGVYLGRNTYSTYSKSVNGKYYYYYKAPFAESDIKFITIGSQVSILPSCKMSNGNYWRECEKEVGFFYNCKSLKNIVFEGKDILFEQYCFEGTNLTELKFPKGISEFNGSHSLPSSINTITFGKRCDYSSFSNLTSLERITCTSSTPPFKGHSTSFTNNQYISVKVLVPYGSKETYQNAETWKNFWNIEEMPGVPTERVEINMLNTKIQVGDSLQLTGTRYPENSFDPIQWKSSDVKIATVSDAGLVKAVAPGKVTITATSGKASTTCEVTVSPIAAQKIILSKDKVSVNVADTIKITATVQPENTTDKTITWTTSDEKIATVSAEGIVTAVKVGTATITAACGDIKATCEVTVQPITAEKIVLSKEKVSINEADTIKISATILPETTTDKTITWSTSDEKIATVSAEGIITAVKVGTATITATCGDIKATCEVTVLPITAEKIVLDLTEVSLMEADTITIKATITPETTTDKTITWTSSDEKVATVSPEGIVTAVGAGKATITATCGERSASCEVTVYSPNVNAEFAENTLTVTVEGSDKPVSVSIYSVMGQCIYQKTIEPAITVTEKIDCSSLAAGTYIVQIISGEMNTSKRIVK